MDFNVPKAPGARSCDINFGYQQDVNTNRFLNVNWLSFKVWWRLITMTPRDIFNGWWIRWVMALLLLHTAAPNRRLETTWVISESVWVATVELTDGMRVNKVTQVRDMILYLHGYASKKDTSERFDNCLSVWTVKPYHGWKLCSSWPTVCRVQGCESRGGLQDSSHDNKCWKKHEENKNWEAHTKGNVM